MSRLPVVGSDSNAWGAVLNDFLSVAHNTDGSIKNLFINVKDPAYGAKGDNATDDTVAIAAARSAANSAGGGIVFYPPGTYITGNQTIYPKVLDVGTGKNATTLKLKNASNTDLFSGQTGSINLSAAFGVGSAGTLFNFGWMNMTLDGNKANQSAGPSYPIRVYGYSYKLENVEIKNGYSGGVLSDWNGPSPTPPGDGVESFWNEVKVHDCGGHGIQFGGPHDSQFKNIIPYSNAGHNLHLAPNAGGTQVANFHGWGNFGTGFVGLLVETTYCIFTNCVIESPSDTYCIVLLGTKNIFRACVARGNGTTNTFTGIKLGQAASETVIPGQILQSAGVTTFAAADDNMIDMLITDCAGTHGALQMDGVHNSIITVHCNQINGVVSTGFVDPTNQMTITVYGLTPDGTQAKGGIQRFAIDAFNGYTVGDMSYNDYFNIATHAGSTRVELPNNTYFAMYSDAYNTTTLQLRGGTVCYAQSATAAVITSAGGAPSTITTAGVGIARVAPTANVTGIILQAGTLVGQIVVVRNESAFTVTFNATPATSHVADAAAVLAIPANTSRMFEWNSVASLWSRCNG